MAAGLSLPAEHVELFRKSINANCPLTEELLVPKLYYDAILPVSYAGEPLLKELEYLEPFGKGNEKPVFAAGNLKVCSARILGKNANVLKLQLEDKDGFCIDAVRFGDVKADLELLEGKDLISILYYPEWNAYQGRRTVQLMIQSIR